LALAESLPGDAEGTATARPVYLLRSVAQAIGRRRREVEMQCCRFRIAVTVSLLIVTALALLPRGTVAEAGGGGCHATAVEARTAQAVDLVASCFAPTIARIAVGDTVTWTNDDPYAHVISAAANSFDGYRQIEPGQSFSVRFDAPGIFPYFCPLHAAMAGAIVVGDGAAGADVVSAARSGAAAAGTVELRTEAPDGPTDRAAAAGWLTFGVLAGAVATLGGARLRRRG
jgi:plastocyanin